jgi:hypothetical protein
MSLLEVCRWLEGTRGSIALHESIWVYPIVESIHFLTLCLFLGLTVMIDLRLLGASLSATPVSRVIRRLGPWMLAGFAVMVASGAMLFYAAPVKTYSNVFFRLKMTFLLMAGLNVAVFQVYVANSAPLCFARLDYRTAIMQIQWWGVEACTSIERSR